MSGTQIDILEKGRGWVVIKLRAPEDATAETVAAMHDATLGYLMKHPECQVRAALSFVADGQTIAVHLWLTELA